MNPIVIAIDGPAGAGKSTVAKFLAKRLHLRYLDTGAMYRCVALAALRKGVGKDDGEAAAEIARQIHIDFAEPDDADGVAATQRVLLNGEDVSEAIRTLEIGELASALSAHSAVRKELVRLQKEIVSHGGVTLEGRDTTTVVAPDADFKVYLTADLRTRASRRLAEFQTKQPGISLEEVEAMIASRDHRDSTRADSPLSVAEGASVLDTGGMTIEEVVEAIAQGIESKAETG